MNILRTRTMPFALMLLLGLFVSQCAAQAGKGEQSEPSKGDPSKADAAKAKALFDGKTLTGWKKTNFGGEGEVTVEKGQIMLEMGDPLTGITWQKAEDLPKDNYEVSLAAMKLKGDDFFCALTFPVRDSHASFIVGGWAGGIVGISSINGFDASENETTTYHKFKHDQWYQIRVRVAGGKLQAWIDDKQQVDIDLKDKKISTRSEVDVSKPLGISAYHVKAALKDIQLKRVGSGQ